MSREIRRRGLIILCVVGSILLMNERSFSLGVKNTVIFKKNNVSYLSDMRPASAKGKYTKDKNIEGSRIILGRFIFEKGLTFTTGTELEYATKGKYKMLKAVIGNDFAFSEYAGQLIFEVYADGKKIYESRPLVQKENETIGVPITGAKIITLKVKGSIPTNFVAWADAQLF